MQNRPELDIAIVREGGKMKFSIGNFQLKLIPVEKGTQRYDFVALEQFLTKVATIKYEEIVRREGLIKDLASLDDSDEGALVA